jgi:sulfur carrier protein ThiS
MGFDSMKINVKLQRSDETRNLKLKSNSTIQDLLKKMGIKPDTVIVMNKNKPMPIDDVIVDGQELTILQVSSGG